MRGTGDYAGIAGIAGSGGSGHAGLGSPWYARFEGFITLRMQGAVLGRKVARYVRKNYFRPTK